MSLEQSGGAPTNRITSVTAGSTLNYSYDAAGNVTNDGVHSYTYDAENRVVSVDGGSTATYSYDHQNRRVKKVVGSTTTHYVWQSYQMLAEHNGNTGAVVAEYVYAGQRMIAKEQNGRVFFLNDRLSIRATITDGQGGIQGRQTHLPFGEEITSTGQQDKHHFTNYERDTETDMDFAVNRHYRQSSGRFHQVDRYSGSISAPQSLNRFAYSQNDSINLKDPVGLSPQDPEERGGGGGGGVVFPCTNGIFGVTVILDGFEIPWEFCILAIVPIIIISQPDSEPQAKNWPGFSSDEVEILDAGLSAGKRLLNNTACQRGLADRGIDIAQLIGLLNRIRFKRDNEDATIPGNYFVFNGRTSDFAEVKAANSAGNFAGAIVANQTRIAGPRSDLFIFSKFYDARGDARIDGTTSRGVFFIHEGIHFLGRDDNSFRYRDDKLNLRGSDALNTIIVKACVNTNFDYRDLALVFP
jgi:RHS repeat-associated protein